MSAVITLGGCAATTDRAAVAPAVAEPSASMVKAVKVIQPMLRSVTMRLVLAHSVVPADGTPIFGYLEVSNTTGKPVTITDACDGWVAVGLSSPRVHFSAAWFAVGCASDYLPLGTSRTPIRVDTSYSECLEPGGSSIEPMVHCVGPQHRDSPPLPAGRYVTTTELRGLLPQIASAPPVTVTLVPVTRRAGSGANLSRWQR